LERKKKQKVVEDLEAKLKDLKYMFLSDYSGMNVAQMTRLRRELRNVNAEFTVVKNSLLKIASEGTGVSLLKEMLQGPNAIMCIYKDPIAAAKVIAGFSKEMPQLKMKAGLLGQRVITADEILKLATVPPREVLMARFLGLLQSPPQRLLYVLSGNISRLMLTLNAIKQKKEQA
jgi:large subunit ribosomal protein L10